MTLRKIHNNILNFKQIQPINNNYEQQIYYDQEPTHPKIKPFNTNNLKIQIDKNLSQIKQRINVKNQNVKNYQTEKLNVLKNFNFNKRNSEVQNRKNKEQFQLFVPERAKIIKNGKNLNEKINNISSSTQRQTPTRKYSYQVSSNNSNSRKIIPKNYPQKSQIKFISKTINTQRVKRLQKQQNSKQIFLKNRLNFIFIEQERQKQKIQLVKKKFERVLSVRNSNLKQKQIIQQRRIQNVIRSVHENKSRIERVKSQKSEKNLSVSRDRQMKTLTALSVRNQNRLITQQIRNQKIKQLNSNKLLARKTKSSLESSRDRMNQINKSRFNSFRSIQNQKLIKSYVNYENKEKINRKLYETLQNQIKLINERKLKAASQLKQYQAILNPSGRKNGNNNLNSSRISNKSKTFYLTNY